MRTRAFAARLLLLSLATLLTAMPWTEHLTNWDRFFRGGQDVEFGLLAIGVAFGLAFLLVQHRTPLVPALLARRHPHDPSQRFLRCFAREPGRPAVGAQAPPTPLRI